MSSSNVFRSHLMQQFASVARTQSRPPLTLASSSKRQSSFVASDRQTSLPLVDYNVRETNSVHRQHVSATPSEMRVIQAIAVQRQQQQLQKGTQDQYETNDDHNDSSATETETDTTPFQSTILSRRTISNFTPLPPDLLKSSLDRAIQCAQTAPNHKHTEPTFFKRMIHPSPSISALAEIAYHVTYQRKLNTDPLHAEVFATRKRDKWNQIPAYLVVAVKHQPPVIKDGETNDANHANDTYNELSFVPPATPMQLEDYATACAAIQNILLSLHSEGIGTKWATGPVMNTKAIRTLLGLCHTDRIVGLIMVGGIGFQPGPRKMQQEWQELVEDL